jgi:hypothetical protein
MRVPTTDKATRMYRPREIHSFCKKVLSRSWSSEARAIALQIEAWTGTGHEVELEIRGNGVATPSQTVNTPATLERQEPDSGRPASASSVGSTGCSATWLMPGSSETGPRRLGSVHGRHLRHSANSSGLRDPGLLTSAFAWSTPKVSRRLYHATVPAQVTDPFWAHALEDGRKCVNPACALNRLYLCGLRPATGTPDEVV